MNFLLTKYIYPIEAVIPLSEKLKFYLDNPRTEEEIALVRAHVEKSLNSPDEAYDDIHYMRIPIYSKDAPEGTLTVESSLHYLEENYSPLDICVRDFFQKNKDKDLIGKLTRMWIIARYDDEGEHEELKRIAEDSRKQGESGFFMLGTENPIVRNSENLIGYCCLLSLLVEKENESYYGYSFLIQHDSDSIQTPRINRFLNKSVVFLGFMAYSTELLHKEDRWGYFYYLKDEITEVSKRLDSVIDESNKEKMLYIANLLKIIAHEIKDGRLKLVTLVSIIELLLTHSPDYRRFNIEDSISKQFRLKTSLLVYQNDKSKDLNWIKTRLRDIYNQRSNIAHGNFKSLTDYLKKEVKKSNDEDTDDEIILERLNSDIYDFIRAIIEEYIKDRKLVEFLKEN